MIARARAVLAAASTIHFVHDGFSDILYVFLPLWANEFGLSLAQVGVIRTTYTGGMALFQIPAGFLAERLQLRHHSVVELVDRLVERDMVTRRRDGSDRREVSVALRPSGEAVLRKLALYSMEELRTEGPELLRVLRRLMPGRGRARREQRTARTGGTQ